MSGWPAKTVFSPVKCHEGQDYLSRFEVRRRVAAFVGESVVTGRCRNQHSSVEKSTCRVAGKAIGSASRAHPAKDAFSFRFVSTLPVVMPM